MAAQSDADRLAHCNALMDEMSNLGLLSGCNKPQLRAVYNALDQWVSDNAGSVNSAIPQPQRGNMSTEAKAILFRRVVADRYLKGL